MGFGSNHADMKAPVSEPNAVRENDDRLVRTSSAQIFRKAKFQNTVLSACRIYVLRLIQIGGAGLPGRNGESDHSEVDIQ